MPYRLLAATELAEFLRALAHPRRVQIVEELRGRECDVASVAKATGLTPSNVSQHLMVLRAHRVVSERREGRRVFYRLRSAGLADWLVQGMDFLPQVDEQASEECPGTGKQGGAAERKTLPWAGQAGCEADQTGARRRSQRPRRPDRLGKAQSTSGHEARQEGPTRRDRAT